MHANDFRLHVRELGVGRAEPLGLVAPQIVEHRVRRAHEFAEHTLRLGMLHIKRDTALVAVERLEEVTVARPKEVWPDGASDVATLGRVLDLDDLGAEVEPVACCRTVRRRIASRR